MTIDTFIGEASSICTNVLGTDKKIPSHKVNGEAETFIDDSEEGDEIDDESLCTFYSGKIHLLYN